jgi:hypothetical protein
MRSFGVMRREGRRLFVGLPGDDRGDRGRSPHDTDTSSAASWEELWPRNLCGVARALTTCSAMGWFGVVRLRCFFWVRYHVPPFRRWEAKPLVKLSFIHFAQWAMIDRLPGNDGMDDERLRPRYLLFLTNFNGGFDPYIDAFSYVIGFRMKMIWGSGPGFPGPKPATRFMDYIHRQEFPALHFYSAYPDATATQVCEALEVAERFDDFVAAADDDAFAFADAWAALMTEIQTSL